MTTVNMSRWDQALRFGLGTGMLSMLFFVPASGYWGLLGVLPMISAVTRHCPGYRLLGIRTARGKDVLPAKANTK